MPSHELMNPSTESAGFAMLHINPHGVARTISPRRNTGETVSLPGSVCFPATAYQQTYMNRLHSPHSPSPPRQELLSSTLISPNTRHSFRQQPSNQPFSITMHFSISTLPLIALLTALSHLASATPTPDGTIMARDVCGSGYPGYTRRMGSPCKASNGVHEFCSCDRTNIVSWLALADSRIFC